MHQIKSHLFLQHPKKKFFTFLVLDLLFFFSCSCLSCICLLASAMSLMIIPPINLVIPKYYYGYNHI